MQDNKLNDIDKNLLNEVSNLDNLEKGAYNITQNLNLYIYQ